MAPKGGCGGCAHCSAAEPQQAEAAAAAKKQPAKRKAGAAAALLQRKRLKKNAVLAERRYKKGECIFVEPAAVSVQAQRAQYEEHLVPKPLYCTRCSAPVGPLEAALALAGGHAARADVVDVARSTGGAGGEILRWLAFAAKLPQFSQGEFASEGVFVDVPQVTQPRTQGVFCCAACKDDWLLQGQRVPALRGEGEGWSRLCEHAQASGHECLLLMAARAVVQRWPPSSAEALSAALSDFLAPLPADAECNVPQEVLAEAHGQLVEMLGSNAGVEAKSLVPAALHARLCAALDLYGWALDGTTLPSCLGLFCEERLPKLPEAAGAEAMAALGPVVRMLCEQRERLEGGCDGGTGCGGCEDPDCDSKQAGAGHPDPWASLPEPEVAQDMVPTVLPAVLSTEEVAELKALSQELAQQLDHAKHTAGGQWRTRYLHQGHRLGRAAPALLAKLVAAAKAGDKWGLISKIKDPSMLRPRCVEHHLVSPGGALPDPTHYDGGSLLTLDVMLARPGEDFQGGAFCTLEKDGSQREHSFGLGDALVFASHKMHHVRPVTSGLRETLILELWEGEERACDHRCERHWGACAFEATGACPAEGGASKGLEGMSQEEVVRDGPQAFAPTSFEGQAFFPRVGRVMAQSARERERRSPNVEVAFEDPFPRATVRALRTIRRGEPLVVPAYDEASSDEGESGEEEEGAESEEEQ